LEASPVRDNQKPKGKGQSSFLYKKAWDDDSSDSKSDSGKKNGGEDMAESYIKQYYLKKYGSAKKGFDPNK